MKNIFKELVRCEKGQALVMVLGFLAIGGLTIAPVLSYMNTGLHSGQLQKERMIGSYAADAGVELALWNLTINGLEIPEGEQSILPQFTSNNQTVNVTIDNIDSRTYAITSTATNEYGPSTTIESHVDLLVAYTIATIDPEAILTVRHSALIDGDIYYAGDLEILDDASINGETIAGDPFDIGIDTEEYKVEAQSGGTYNGDLTINSSPYTLGPLYITGKLTIKKEVDITLEGTVYVEKIIIIEDDVSITGVGNILAVNQDDKGKSIDIHNRVTINLDNLPLIMSASDTGEIKVGDDCNITGLLYNTGGRIHVHGGTTSIYGAVIGKGARICEGTTITYHPDIPSLAPFAWRVQTWQINPQ